MTDGVPSALHAPAAAARIGGALSTRGVPLVVLVLLALVPFVAG